MKKSTKHKSPMTAMEHKPVGKKLTASKSKNKVSKTKDKVEIGLMKVSNIKTQEEANAEAKKEIARSDWSQFRLGGILGKIRSEGWFGEHTSFTELCEIGYGINIRKAEYLMRNYIWAVEGNLTSKQINSLTWTKLRLLAQHVPYKEAKKWAKKAKNLTNTDLEAELKSLSSEDGPSAEKTTTLIFKPHDDQREIIDKAIDRAKEQGGTKYGTVALYYICLDFLAAGNKTLKPVSIKKKKKKSSKPESS